MTKKKEKPLTKDSVDMMRSGTKIQRICMSEDGMIFAPTLEGIKKHNYRLIEDIPKSEWGLDDPDLTEHEHKAIAETMKALSELNGVLESGENKIEG